MNAETDAAVAALQAVWVPERVHRMGEVPATPATPYAVVSVDGGLGSNLRLTGDPAADAYRLVVMAVGDDSSEIEFAVEKIRAAYRGQRLAVSGVDTTPLVGESSGPLTRDPDGGVLLSLTFVYTFTAYQIA